MENTVILYTIGCPKCKVLEKKMEAAGLKYDVVDDVDVMTELGIKSAPVLRVNDEFMLFPEAIKWVNAYAKEHKMPD